MGECAYRSAIKADITALHALVEGAYRGTSAKGGWTHEADLLEGQRTDVEELEQIIQDPTQQIILAVDGDAIAGCVCIANKGGGLSYLGMLTVDPQRQSGGLGRQLIAAGEQAAVRDFQADRMEMTVIAQRPELIAYYERRGYGLTGQSRPFPMDDPRFGVPLRNDLRFVVMEKALA